MAQDDSKLNVIFICGDNVGYGDVCCYGAEKVKLRDRRITLCSGLGV